MSGVTKFKTLPMRVRKSSKLRGSGGTYTLSLTKPHVFHLSEDGAPSHWKLEGFVKDKVYVPPLQQNLENLRTRIGNVLNLITPDMLKRVWEEMDYRLDVVCVTRGSDIEHL
ncbi:hypothetical protein AVEN_102276-1 [Araneus ventricosus]|uniref:Uncharacterized protein n=1 Tax=Araneus ventricosus TaxID=182803 RepID=A0A4Y2MAC3_ARAVE|nr:hypothetical protein AVEN_102276-1 [Araneus ventricosus]